VLGWERESARPDINNEKEDLHMMKSIAIIATSAALAAFGTTYAETSAAGSQPNDAQIAQIVLTADTVDVDYGKLAANKTSNPEVKAFAETMVRDHSAVNEKATALAHKLGVTPEASETSKSLKLDGHKELAKLKAMHGTEFDKAYIDNEVRYYEAVIGVLDNTLIPSAKNAELKSLLESGRPIFVSHLEHAKQLQKSLTK
jgi:putative membrane protein